MSKSNSIEILSNQPLRVLANHVYDLRKLWYSEHEQNRKLKGFLNSARDYILQGKKEEFLSQLLSRIDSELGLDDTCSTEENLSSKNQELALLLYKLWTRRVQTAFQNLKKTPNSKLALVLEKFFQRRTFDAFKRVQFLTKPFLSPNKSQLSKREMSVLYSPNLSTINSNRYSVDLLVVVKKLFSRQLSQHFQLLNFFGTFKTQWLSRTLELQQVKQNKLLLKKYFSVYLQKHKTKKHTPTLLKLGTRFSLREKKLQENSLKSIRDFGEFLAVTEEGFDIISSVLTPFVNSELLAVGFQKLKNQPSKSNFLGCNTLYKAFSKRLKKAFRHINKVSKTEEILSEWEQMQLKLVLKPVLKHCEFSHKKLLERAFIHFKAGVCVSVKQKRVNLNKDQVKAALVLNSLSVLPKNYSQRLLKHSFLHIVRYVTQSITQSNILYERLSEVWNLMGRACSFKLHRAFLAWKKPYNLDASFISCSLPFALKNTLGKQLSKRLKTSWDLLKQHYFKVTLLKLKLVYEQQGYLRVSCAFKAWKSTLKLENKLLKRTKVSINRKGPRVPLRQLTDAEYS